VVGGGLVVSGPTVEPVDPVVSVSSGAWVVLVDSEVVVCSSSSQSLGGRTLVQRDSPASARSSFGPHLTLAVTLMTTSRGSSSRCWPENSKPLSGPKWSSNSAIGSARCPCSPASRILTWTSLLVRFSGVASSSFQAVAVNFTRPWQSCSPSISG
jgi:hypothetical protein